MNMGYLSLRSVASRDKAYHHFSWALSAYYPWNSRNTEPSRGPMLPPRHQPTAPWKAFSYSSLRRPTLQRKLLGPGAPSSGLGGVEESGESVQKETWKVRGNFPRGGAKSKILSSKFHSCGCSRA
jgi:hypothetical protein